MNILDPRFVYVDAVHTDIRQTFAKYGWTAPSGIRPATTDAQPRFDINEYIKEG